MRSTIIKRRSVISIAGSDRLAFLNGLISNDLKKLAPGKAIYSTLLTPQGRFLFDFFILEQKEAYLLDIETARAGDLLRRLRMFKLRSNVELSETDYRVEVNLGENSKSNLAFTDPRLAALGQRAFVKDGTEDPAMIAAYDEKRMELGVPEGGIELLPEKSILLENGLDELNAIDWEKGCYMGQELTARTRYRGLVRKRLLPFHVEETLPAPDAWDQEGIHLLSVSPSGHIALGIARLEHLEKWTKEGTKIGAAHLRAYIPDWMRLPKIEAETGT